MNRFYRVIILLILLVPQISYAYSGRHGASIVLSTVKAVTQLLADAQGNTLTNQKEALVLRSVSSLASFAEKVCAQNFHGGMGVASTVAGCSVDLCDLAERCEEFVAMRKKSILGEKEKEKDEQEEKNNRVIEWRRIMRLFFILGEWACAISTVDPIHTQMSSGLFIIIKLLHILFGDLLRIVRCDKKDYQSKSIIGALKYGAVATHNLLVLGTLATVPVFNSPASAGSRKREEKRQWFEDELWADQDIRPGLQGFDDCVECGGCGDCGDEGFECPICCGEDDEGNLLTYKRKEMVLGSGCLNMICKTCWQKCKKEKKSCPMCNRKVLLGENAIEDKEHQEIMLG